MTRPPQPHIHRPPEEPSITRPPVTVHAQTVPSFRRSNPVWTKALLGYLAATGVPIGLWQLLWPRSFYDEFPGFGRAWVAVDGPYNEHLIRDVGGGTLALAVLAVFALVRTSALLVRAVALGVLAAQVPHFVYHVAHAGLLPTTADRILNTVFLGSGIVVALILLRVSCLEVSSPAQPSTPSCAPSSGAMASRSPPDG